MNVPSLQNVVDIVALQNAITLILLSDDRLAKVPMVPEFKLHMESDMQVDILWTLPRNAVNVQPSGPSGQVNVVDDADPAVGAGLLIEMPTARCHSPGVSGPALTWELTVVAMEERNVNFSVNGLLISAEQLILLVLDILHLQSIKGYGQFQASAAAIGPAQDWMTIKPGILAMRGTLQATVGRPQTQRCKGVKVYSAGGLVQMECPEPDATVLYTLDGSMPVKANASAQTYTQPFDAADVGTVTAAAWVAGKLISEVSRATL